MSPRRFFPLLGLFLVGLPAVSQAWPADVYRSMVYDTLRLMPPSLARVLWRNDEQLLSGVYRLEGQMASSLARDGLIGGLSEATTGAVEQRIASVAKLVDQQRPFREVAYEMGKLLRIAADLADPSVMGAGSPPLASASSELHRFITLHLGEIPLVYDRSLPSPLQGASVPSLLERIVHATDDSVERLAKAFWRQGALVPATEFDFRSVPFAEVSLGYSRAVTAASYLWLAAWVQANGDLTGYRFLGDNSPQRFITSKSNRKRQ